MLFGGSTVHEMPTSLRQLTAQRAVDLDGGDSTTLLVRTSATGSPYALDRLSWTRSVVPNALTWFWPGPVSPG